MSFESNTATYGAAVYIDEYNNDIQFYSPSFIANNAVTHIGGAGMYINLGNYDIQLYDSVFLNNRASDGLYSIGGGMCIYRLNHDIELIGGTFQGNFADSSGGAIIITTENTDILISGVAFIQNSVYYDASARFL